jgi:YD repeat-containing protein
MQSSGMSADLGDAQCVSGGFYYIGNPQRSSITRPGTQRICYYYHFDELGSTRLLTNATGNITDRYTYDAYGSLLSHDCYDGSDNQPYQYVGQLGYYTQYTEPDLGLLQLGVQFYDPEVRRFW